MVKLETNLLIGPLLGGFNCLLKYLLYFLSHICVGVVSPVSLSLTEINIRDYVQEYKKVFVGKTTQVMDDLCQILRDIPTPECQKASVINLANVQFTALSECLSQLERSLPLIIADSVRFIYILEWWVCFLYCTRWNMTPYYEKASGQRGRGARNRMANDCTIGVGDREMYPEWTLFLLL